MDDSRAEKGEGEAEAEGSTSYSAGAGVPLANPETESTKEESGAGEPSSVEDQVAEDQEPSEPIFVDSEEELEGDETEGPRKAIRRSFRAVKRFFKGSGDHKKGGDPQSTFEGETPPPDISPDDTDADGDVYNFTHDKRGRAIIINNEQFHPFSSFGSRPGSKYDETSLKEVFRHLGFDVKCYNDLKAGEMKEVLEKEARLYDHNKADCLAVAVLSHGDSEVVERAWSYHQQKAHQHDDKVRRDLIFGVDGSFISTASIIRTFQDDRCPGLRGKPRLFFLQACRGDSYDEGLEVRVVHRKTSPRDTDHRDHAGGELEETDARGFKFHRRYTVSPAPIFKDFLVMYATTPGHFAWRRSTGTWFIQSLHSVVTRQLTPHMSLTQALTRVICLVALGYESQGEKTGKKQTPVLQSMLTKDIYFTKK